MKTSKLLVICPNSTYMTEGGFFLIDPENGEVLASHYCSNASYAYGDLYGCRPERKEEFEKRYGNVNVKFIDHTDLNENDIFEKNQKYYADNG